MGCYLPCPVDHRLLFLPGQHGKMVQNIRVHGKFHGKTDGKLFVLDDRNHSSLFLVFYQIVWVETGENIPLKLTFPGCIGTINRRKVSWKRYCKKMGKRRE